MTDSRSVDQGSIPCSPTTARECSSTWLEHSADNREVEGSSPSVPTIQVHARPLFGVQWICPYCTSLNSTHNVWRTGRLVCGRRVCRRVNAIGMGFMRRLTTSGLPFTCAVLAAAPAGQVVNTIDTLPQGRPIIGRFLGAVEWTCPLCEHHEAKQTLHWDRSMLACWACGTPFFVHLILYPFRRGPQDRTPLDWMGPAHDQKPVSDSVPPS